MGFFDYLYDTEYRQRSDINRTRDLAADLDSQLTGVSHDLGHLANTVRELGITVRVLVSMLEERGGLDSAQLRDRLERELHPRQWAKAQREREAADAEIHGAVRTGPAPAVAAAPVGHPAKCAMCGAEGITSEMVKFGASYWCRPCVKK